MGKETACYEERRGIFKDEVNVNENLLELHVKPKINKSSCVLKSKLSKIEEKEKCVYNSFNVFPYGGLYYHDIILKDILKFSFKNERSNIRTGSKSEDNNYVYIGAGIMKNMKKKKKQGKK